MRSQARVKDYGEPLLFEAELAAQGLACEPFWSNHTDLEGATYATYIRNHPDFSLGLRKSVVQRLVVVQEELPDDWQLILKAGYRPMEVQRTLLQAFTSHAQSLHPDWTEQQRLEHARTYVSDPDRLIPPHTTGGAVDVDVRDRVTGASIDMGCPPNTDDEISFLHSSLISDTQRGNRMTLLRAMLRVGFAPLYSEWWHFQYGETLWAEFYGHDETLYDVI